MFFCAEILCAYKSSVLSWFLYSLVVVHSGLPGAVPLRLLWARGLWRWFHLDNKKVPEWCESSLRAAHGTNWVPVLTWLVLTKIYDWKLTLGCLMHLKLKHILLTFNSSERKKKASVLLRMKDLLNEGSVNTFPLARRTLPTQLCSCTLREREWPLMGGKLLLSWMHI